MEIVVNFVKAEEWEPCQATKENIKIYFEHNYSKAWKDERKNQLSKLILQHKQL